MSVLQKYNINPAIDDANVLVYVVPKGTRLYRGDTTLYQSIQNIPNKRAFFALEKCRSRPYGILHTFEVKEDFVIPRTDIDNDAILHYIKQAEDQDQIKKGDTEKARKILSRNFGFGKGNKRETIREKDYELLDIMCKTGFSGYMGDEMEIDGFQNIDDPERKPGENEEIDESKFHREIALCNPQDMLKYVGTDNYTEEEKRELIEKENLKKINEQEAKKREDAKGRNNKRSSEKERVEGKSIPFEDMQDESDPFAPRNDQDDDSIGPMNLNFGYGSPPKKAKQDRDRADSIGSYASSAQGSSAAASRPGSAQSIADSLAGHGIILPPQRGEPISNRMQRAPSQPALSPHGRLSGPQKFSPSPSEKNKLEGLIKIEGIQVSEQEKERLQNLSPQVFLSSEAEEKAPKPGVFLTPSPRTPKKEDNEESVKMTPKGGKKKKSRKQMKKRKKSRKHKKSRKAKKVKSARKTKRKQKTRKYKK